jgi:mannosyltransferase
MKRDFCEKIAQQNKMNFFRTHRILLWVFSFFLLGLLIRIYKLGDHNLWFDEYFSLKITTNFSFWGMDYNPPFYYMLSSFWIRSVGPTLANYLADGEFILRSLSMIFGVISIPFIYALGKLLFNTKVGLISAFFLSISPMHIWYSQEARGYSLAVLLTMLTVFVFYRALLENKSWLWAGFSVASLSAIFSNYFSFFIIISVGIFFLFRTYRQFVKPYCASLCFILFGFVPFLPLFFKQVIMVEKTFWIAKPSLSSMIITLGNFNAGYNATYGILFLSL